MHRLRQTATSTPTTTSFAATPAASASKTARQSAVWPVPLRRMAGWVALLLLLAPALASADGNQTESESGDEGERPGWAQRLYDYGGPPEYKVFEVAGHRFRVPYDYLTASSDQERGVFQIAPHWPTLDSPRTDKPQPRHRDDFDTLLVTVRAWPKDDYERRMNDVLEDVRRMNESEAKSSEGIDRVYGLMRSNSFLYSPVPVRIGRVEQFIRIICGSTDCWIKYAPLPKISVEIEFAKTILSDWRKLVRRVNALLMEYKKEK